MNNANNYPQEKPQIPDSDKTAALVEIHSIAKNFSLSLDEIIASFNTDGTMPHSTKSKFGKDILSRLTAYIGGIFIFSGLSVFISMFWDDLNFASQLIITFGAGMVSTIIGVFCVLDDRYLRASPALFLIGAILQGIGILLFFDKFGQGGDPELATLIMCLTILFEYLAIFYKLKRSTLLFIALFFLGGAFASATELFEIDEDLAIITLGISYMAICFHLSKTRFKDITAFWYFIGGMFLSYGVFDVVHNNIFHFSHLLLSCFILYLGTYVRSRSLLVVGTISLLAYISWFSFEKMDMNEFWPLILIILGLIMIGLSAFVIKLDKKFIQTKKVSQNLAPDVPESQENP